MLIKAKRTSNKVFGTKSPPSYRIVSFEGAKLRVEEYDTWSSAEAPGDGEYIRLTYICPERTVDPWPNIPAIDAPELHGCPRTRHCAPGDPVASRASLTRLIAGRVVTFEPVTVDRYGRTVAIVRVGAVNASCHQIAGEHARYWARYDRGGRIARECRLR